MEAVEHRIREIETTVRRHDRDLYQGNGKPAITVRMAVMEDCVERINRNLSKISYLLISTLITAVATIIVTLVMRSK